MENAERFQALGVALVVIGNGAPHFAQAFLDEFKVTLPLYTDPSLKVYDAMALRRGWRTAFSRKTLSASVDALKRGFRQGRTQGDATQQGGVFVLRKGGEIVYRYVSEAAGDHPPLDEVLAAAAKAGRG
jgi:peroxiredoxin